MSKNTLLIILVFFLSAGLVYMAVDKVAERKSRQLMEEEYKIKEDDIQRLLDESAQLKEKLEEEKKIIQPEKLTDVFGEPTPSYEMQFESTSDREAEEVVTEINCGSIKERILNFFSYLDRRDYIKEYELKDGTYAFYKETITELSKERPVAGEEHFPAGLKKNIYHFYRALNKKTIIFIKDVVKNEKDITEQTMDYFYQLQIRCEDTKQFLPSFDTLYEYSHFFLNTLGGKAYLFRLESKIRILLLYYSIMIIHEADNREINKYGFDIRSIISIIEDDLNNYSKYYLSEKYMGEIAKIKKNFTMPFPAAS